MTAAEVLRRVDITLPTGHTVEDDLLRITCGQCLLDQSLSEATITPAGRAEDITAYLCRDCGSLLLVTGHPSPVPLPGSGRQTFGNFAIAPLTPSGLRMSLGGDQ